MNFRFWPARIALALSLSLLVAQPAQAQFWQCAPFARMISGINIFGNAGTWWAQAAGKFARGHMPKVGVGDGVHPDREDADRPRRDGEQGAGRRAKCC